MEQNPALLGPEFDHQVGVNYMKYIGSTNFAGVRYGQGITEHSAFAVGIQYYGYGSMTETDAEGNTMGNFSASDINFNVTYSHDIATNIRGGTRVRDKVDPDGFRKIATVADIKNPFDER